LMFQPSKS